MIKAIFIVGPTAVGKTALAIKISKKFPFVLISADSIQVYRSADIISGKDHPKNIHIELIDILPPTNPFNVRDFVDKVRIIVDDPKNQLKTPIIVGGTGLYVKALFDSIDTINVHPNKKLREELSRLNVSQLQEKLRSLDALRLGKMNESDILNSRRLIRAIEIASSQSTSQLRKKQNSLFKIQEVLIIGLSTSDGELRRRIGVRVKRRIENGAKDEAEKLFESYKDLAPQLKIANGYKQMFEFLQDKINWEEAIEQWVTADYQHAKKQMTYFKKLKNIHWYDVGEKGYEEKIFELLKSEIVTDL